MEKNLFFFGITSVIFIASIIAINHITTVAGITLINFWPLFVGFLPLFFATQLETKKTKIIALILSAIFFFIIIISYIKILIWFSDGNYPDMFLLVVGFIWILIASIICCITLIKNKI